MSSKLWLLAVLGGGCKSAQPVGHPDDLDTGEPRPSVDTDGDGVFDEADCDPERAETFPGAPERCDGLDNDCDGRIDDDATISDPWYEDLDGDGYGGRALDVITCDAPYESVAVGGDCDDAAVSVHPDAVEGCNERDDDCDGETDEAGAVDESAWYVDQDGDGHGSSEDPVFACDEPSGYAPYGDDCDDTDPAFHPGAQESDCDDPTDYNCDGSSGRADEDGDGFMACQDCDDAVDTTHPLADERCGGADEDCDGTIDEPDAVDASLWYADGDGDGYGSSEASERTCDPPWGWVDQGADCDDGEATIHPGATEVCDAHDTDEDCDSRADDEDAVATGKTSFYTDADRDGYGLSGAEILACDGDDTLAPKAGDCDDSSAAIHPGGTEVCNGYDEDCDGDTDEACTERCPAYADPTAVPGGHGTRDAAYTTIADAMTYLGTCDEIVLLAGTYEETLDYGGMDLRIESEEGPEVTIIEAPTGGSVVTFDHGETSAAVLKGVTLRGGTGSYHDSLGPYGGGIYLEDASPTLEDLVVEDNSAAVGGGAYLKYFGGQLEGSTFAGNGATYHGGAVYLLESDGVVADNLFEDNDAGQLGASLVVSGSDPLISSNRFIGNGTSTSDSDLYFGNAAALVRNNLVVDSGTVALYLDNDTSDVVNNTIVGAGSYGLQFNADCNGAVVNNIITGSGSHDVVSWTSNQYTLVTFENNDVWGTGYLGAGAPTGSDGNLAVDPLLAGDYTLDATSACVDAGQDTASYGVASDLDGIKRPVGSEYDIGAFESW